MPDTTTAISRVPQGTDLVEWYFTQGWTDGLPVVPPTGEKVAACIAALGGEPEFLECRVPPRYGVLTREVLAIVDIAEQIVSRMPSGSSATWLVQLCGGSAAMTKTVESSAAKPFSTW